MHARHRRPMLALVAGALALIVLTLAPPALAAGSRAAPGDQDQSATDYAGQDTCLTCHEDKNYNTTVHGFVGDARTPAATRGCESCHGPGLAHAEAGGDATKIVNLTKISAAEVSETCLSCHERGDHALWEGSQHDSRDLSCITCHSVHEPKSEKAQLVKVSQVETCAQCHRDKASKLDRSGHMPLREGKMECTSCHNPHGSTNVKLLRVGNSVNEACTSCHTEKRGPFLWEHAAVQENCTTCHDPHGSSNERMLVAKLPMLCQRCHAHTRHPATIYDNRVAQTSNRLFGRSCVQCHSNVHGSNHASGNTFLR